MAEETIPIAESMQHSKYSEIVNLERRLKAKFTRSQAFQELVDKLVDDYVVDTTQSVLISYREHKLEREMTEKNSKLLDEKCMYLQQIFNEEVHAHLKHPFLIKNMIAKDEAHYESLQARMNEIIKDVEIWKKCYIAETDRRVMHIKEAYRGIKDEPHKHTETDIDKNQNTFGSLEDLKIQNSEMKQELSQANDNLKATQEREERYKQKADEIFLQLKSLTTKSQSSMS